jgi:hypothetical protein
MTFPEVAECPMTQVMTETGYLHRKILGLHCKKGFAVFPSPVGMSQTKLSLAGNYLSIPVHGEFG